ncbi:hypothetical protein M3Y97_00936700 [Aphelenchoides bicaudatus]|nr:hypothetical protein M3Y97_00936700 [Aphelenchoides bicaudatus]
MYLFLIGVHKLDLSVGRSHRLLFKGCAEMGDAVVGLIACGVSSLFFGSMFVPVRRYKPGDGIVMQFIMCSIIFTMGLIVFFVRGLPQFQPWAMLGGLGWCVGNLTAMPIIDAIGLGLGVLIWGSVNCCVGWAVGRYGLFGTNANVPSSEIMNYAGLACVIIGGILFSQVKANTARPPAPSIVKEEDEDESPNQPTSVVVAQTEAEQHLLSSEQQAANSPQLPTDQIESWQQNHGTGLSLIAGFCYGTTFVPAIHIQDNPDKFPGASKNGVDYVFSHFTGIYLTSIVVLIGYLAVKRNRPYIDPQIFGPSLLAGLMFVANDSLSQAVTFPINAMVPGVVATLWSVFFFKEITGKRNMQLLGVAVGITLLGAALVGFSK